MNLYAEEKLEYHRSMFMIGHRNIPYNVIENNERVFHADVQGEAYRLERMDDMAETLENQFPGSEYAIIAGIYQNTPVWHLYIEHQESEMKWRITLNVTDTHVEIASESARVIGVKEKITHADDCLAFLINIIKELPQYRLHVVTGNITEVIR